MKRKKRKQDNGAVAPQMQSIVIAVLFILCLIVLLWGITAAVRLLFGLSAMMGA